MPDASRSWYVNSAATPAAKFEDSIIKDLIPFIDSHYRTVPLRRARAVAGLSMGGYGAMFLGLKHSGTFAAIGAFSGALSISHGTPLPTPPNQTEEARRRSEQMMALFGPPDSDARKDRDPFALLDKVPHGQIPTIYIACGGQDFLIQHNRDFVALLAEKEDPLRVPRNLSPRSLLGLLGRPDRDLPQPAGAHPRLPHGPRRSAANAAAHVAPTPAARLILLLERPVRQPFHLLIRYRSRNPQPRHCHILLCLGDKSRQIHPAHPVVQQRLLVLRRVSRHIRFQWSTASNRCRTADSRCAAFPVLSKNARSAAPRIFSA